MAKTCIICGEAAGSREHVFPAALGGRRTNKGIYCGEHNNGYSPLASELSSQFKAINALLGVRGDHADTPHGIAMIDDASGVEIRLSDGKSELAAPKITVVSEENGVSQMTGKFANESQLQDWLKSMREKGYQVKAGDRSPVQERVLSQGGIHLLFGGPKGLRAVGYVALTFLAHHFPDVARTRELDEFKRYTLDQGDDSPHVWWDYDSPSDLPESPFEFGHRVVVGLDPVGAVVYARVSFFSTLQFAVILGPYGGSIVKTVVTHINPLEQRPPDDIAEREFEEALAIVGPPRSQTAGLSENIANGNSQEMFSALMRKIEGYQHARCGEAISERLQGSDKLDETARKELIESIIQGETQRVFNLMRYVVSGLKRQPGFSSSDLIQRLDRIVALDDDQELGLSKEAFASLKLAEMALVDEMLKDLDKGSLTVDRIVMLIGGGPGAAIVAKAITDPILMSLPE